MTDKQLRSLSKTQMLDILHQQEREIEKLNDEMTRPRSDPEATALLSGIMKAAQAAADSYVKNMVVAENEKIEGIAKLESNARHRAEEVERCIEESTEIVVKILTDMCSIFSWQIDLIKSMQDEFFKKIRTTYLKDFIPGTLESLVSGLDTAEPQKSQVSGMSSPKTECVRAQGSEIRSQVTESVRYLSLLTKGQDPDSTGDYQRAEIRAQESEGARSTESQIIGHKARNEEPHPMGSAPNPDSKFQAPNIPLSQKTITLSAQLSNVSDMG